MHTGTVHHHARKRRDAGEELSTSPLARFIDIAVYPIGIASLLMAFPQVYEVWILGNVEGISLASWSAWAFFNIFWIVYGIVHKVPAISYLYVGWFLINGSIALGAFLMS